MHDRSNSEVAPESETDRPATAEPAPQPVAPATASVSPTILVAAAASLGAGLVHAAAAGTHTGADTLVRLFAVCAALQVAWAAPAIARPARSVLTLGLVLNGGAVVAWALSRTRGLPWPAELEEVEEVGTQDLIAAVLGTVAALGAMAALVRPRLARRLRRCPREWSVDPRRSRRPGAGRPGHGGAPLPRREPRAP